MPDHPPDAPPPPAATRTVRLAVLISGGGTTMLNFADRIDAGSLDADIALVLASNDHAAAAGLARAASRGLPAVTARRRDFPDAQTYSEHVFRLVRDHDADLVCLAGFLSLLVIPDDYAGRVLNIHPSLLPKFGGRGMHGRHVHEAVLAAGEAVTGCTVHLADNTYDTGPILLQRTCPVLPNDTPDTLAARVFALECNAYPDAIRSLADQGSSPTAA